MMKQSTEAEIEGCEEQLANKKQADLFHRILEQIRN